MERNKNVICVYSEFFDQPEVLYIHYEWMLQV